MGVCEKLPTMDFDLFVDVFFIVRSDLLVDVFFIV